MWCILVPSWIHLSIYRKPKHTDIIIPNSSFHLYEYELSGINYLLNQLHTYRITEKTKDTERNTIKNILHVNEYSTNLTRTPPPPQKQNKHADPRHKKKMGCLHVQWQRSRKNYSKLFQDMWIKIAFCTQNTMWKILEPHAQIDKYSRSGIYQVKCLDCSLKYIRQTGHLISDVKNIFMTSEATVTPDIGITYVWNHMWWYGCYNKGKEGKYLNTPKRYHIYKISKDNLRMNDIYRHTWPHSLDITWALHKKAAHTYPVICRIRHAKFVRSTYTEWWTTLLHRQGEEPTVRSAYMSIKR
jgi:hypothetical protein